MSGHEILPVLPEGIPAELRSERRWVNWRMHTTSDGRPTKVPYMAAIPSAKADVTKPDSCSDFVTALHVYEQHNADGVGFVLGDGFFGFDADGCRNPHTGEIGDEARDLVAMLDTYTEVSPRGGGVHAVGRGRKPGRKCRVDGYELYDANRFFCVTGHHVANTPTAVEDREEQLAAVYHRL